MPMQGQLIQPNLILPLFGLKRILSDAEIANIFSTPVTIVPVVPGHMIIPVGGHFSRSAGTAWTAGSLTELTITFSGGQVILNSFDATVLTAAAPWAGWMRAGATGVAGNTQFSCITTSPQALEQTVQIKGLGGNPSAGNGGLEVTIFYYLIAMRLGNIG